MSKQPSVKVSQTSFIAAIIIGVILVIAAGIVGYVIGVAKDDSQNDPQASINSFDECADAGYPVQQTFPEVCAVPGGDSFTND